MNEMTNQETDTALILENELKRRVSAVVRSELAGTVHQIVKKELDTYKNEMMTEIMLSIGKALQQIEKEGRTPLWEGPPPTEMFGLTKEDLNTHMINNHVTAEN
jgi:hypothetical protein